MEGFLFLKAIVAFVIVIGMMLGSAWVLKKMGLTKNIPIIGSPTPRLKVVELIPIDNSRRLALLRKDDVEYLMFLGAHAEIMLETGKAPEKPKKIKPEVKRDEYADIL